jgi:hypothetical protein
MTLGLCSFAITVTGGNGCGSSTSHHIFFVLFFLLVLSGALRTLARWTFGPAKLIIATF